MPTNNPQRQRKYLKAVKKPVPGLYRHLTAKACCPPGWSSPATADLGIEHCRERTTMRWDSMRQDGAGLQEFSKLWLNIIFQLQPQDRNIFKKHTIH